MPQELKEIIHEITLERGRIESLLNILLAVFEDKIVCEIDIAVLIRTILSKIQGLKTPLEELNIELKI